jgi:hypothetical protein
MFPVLSRSARLQALAIAVLAAASLVTQWAYLMAWRGTPPLATVVDMARFFTILTALLVMIAFAAAGLSRLRGVSGVMLAALTLSMVLTGGVYHAMLAEYWNPTGIGIAADWGLHTILPVLVFLWWLLHAPKTELVWADLPAFAVWPAVYTAYALGLGTVDGTYPYPFMDPAASGPWPVAATLAMLTLVILLGGVLMIGLGRFIDR